MDINDLTIVLANFGQTGMTWSQGEFTGDGTVDVNDLTIVLANLRPNRRLVGPPGNRARAGRRRAAGRRRGGTPGRVSPEGVNGEGRGESTVVANHRPAGTGPAVTGECGFKWASPR